MSFTLFPIARALAVPPFACELAATRPEDGDRWRIRDARRSTLGYAPTRAGARAAVRDLYAKATPP